MKTNQELLDEANKIDFHVTTQGNASNNIHGKYERGLWFIRNSIHIHGIDKYQYGRVLTYYVDNKTKVPLICPKHGEFWVSPNNHTSKGSGCKMCSLKIPTTEEWIEKARNVHGARYDYSKSVYIGRKEKIEIICPEHGSFWPTAFNHLSGKGCPECAHIHTGNILRHSKEDFINKANQMHGNRYDYSKVVYKNNYTSIEIICPEHGSFLQTPITHTTGSGCPKCAGKNHDILYLLKCTDTGWYKIGITTSNMKTRIKQISGNVEEILHIICEDPRKHETYLHKLYEKDREYNPCVKSGNTEFFSLNEEQVAQVRQYMASIAIN